MLRFPGRYLWKRGPMNKWHLIFYSNIFPFQLLIRQLHATLAAQLSSHIFKPEWFQMCSMAPKTSCLPWSQIIHRSLGYKALKQVRLISSMDQPSYFMLQLQKERKKKNEGKRMRKDRWALISGGSVSPQRCLWVEFRCLVFGNNREKFTRVRFL